MRTLGILSGLVNLAGTLLYIDEIFRRKSVPERATWFVWLILGLVALFSQKSLGATHSLWFVGLQTFGVSLVFLLSLRFGTGGLAKFDIGVLTLAGLGILLWIVTADPLLSLSMVVIVRVIGMAATIRKTARQPRSEALAPWVLYATSGLLAMLSVGRLDLPLLLYPTYALVADSSVIIVKVFEQKRKGLKFISKRSR